MKPDVREMQLKVRAEVGMPSRLAHTALLVAAAGMTATTASLWATEVALPQRTQWAFALIVVIGAAWMIFAGWVLLQRRVLYGRQRIVAAKLALFASSVFVVGSILLRERVGMGATLAGAVMWLIAAITLASARRHVRRLQVKKQALQQEALR